MRQFNGCYFRCAYSRDVVVGSYDNILEVLDGDKLYGHLYGRLFSETGLPKSRQMTPEYA